MPTMDSSFDPSIFNSPIQSEPSFASLSKTSNIAHTIVEARKISTQLDKALLKLDNPKSLMIISKAQDDYVIRLTQQLVYWLIMSSKKNEENNKSRKELHIYVDGNLAGNPIFNYKQLLKINSDFERLLHFWTPQFCSETEGLDNLIDFIITLGGDGTVLYASWLFQNSQVPPVIPINMGSLGFFTVFNFNNITDVLCKILGPKENKNKALRSNSEKQKRDVKAVSSSTTTQEVKPKSKEEEEGEKKIEDANLNLEEKINTKPPTFDESTQKQHHQKHKQNEFQYQQQQQQQLRVNIRMRFKCTVWRCAKRKGADDPELISYKQKQREKKRIQLELNRICSPIRSSRNEDKLNEFKSEIKSNMENSRSDDLYAGPEEQKFDNLSTQIIGDSSALLSHMSKQQKYIQSPSFMYPPSNSRYKTKYSNPVPTETFQILNEVVVDRGPSSYMSHMELYGNNRHLTTVQADGLVVATPTGSTAYSLSAGGPIVHPHVQTMLVTPICPHTLSFRPMLLPDNIELKIMVPKDSRNTAWASFDGRHRIELKQGDFITVTSSLYPMPTICSNDQSEDWFNSLRRCLKWNDRVRQKAFSNSEYNLSKALSAKELKQELDDVMQNVFKNTNCWEQPKGPIFSNQDSDSDFNINNNNNYFNYQYYNLQDGNSRFSDSEMPIRDAYFQPANVYSNGSSQYNSGSLGGGTSYQRPGPHQKFNSNYSDNEMMDGGRGMYSNSSLNRINRDDQGPEGSTDKLNHSDLKLNGKSKSFIVGSDDESTDSAMNNESLNLGAKLSINDIGFV